MSSAGRRSVVDVALRGGALTEPAVASRARILGRLRLKDTIFHNMTRLSAMGVLVILAGVMISLFHGSLPAIQAFGLGFLVQQVWNPVTERFGALAPIYGTIITSFIAMAIAVPIGLLITLF